MNHTKNIQIEINENDNILEIIEYINNISKLDKNLKCFRNTTIPLSNITEKEFNKKWNKNENI